MAAAISNAGKKGAFRAMKIEHREYALAYQGVLFNVADGGECFVCLVPGADLEYPLIEGERAEAQFDACTGEILKAAIPVIQEAKKNGIRHHRGVKNEPLVVRLSPFP